MDKNRPIGSFHILDMPFVKENMVEKRDGSGWKPARPLPYYSLKERLKMVWDILTYKADALYW